MPGMAPPDEENAAASPPAANDNRAAPAEQAQYNQFVGRAMELIYNAQMFPKIVEMLRGGSDEGSDAKGSVDGLAMATVMVLTRVVSAAKEAGQSLSPDVLLHGGSEVFAQLAEISDKAGISDYANDRDTLEGAFFRTIDMYIDQARKSGELDEAAAKQQMAQLTAMDQNGQLEQLLSKINQSESAPAEDEEAAAAPPGRGMAPMEAS